MVILLTVLTFCLIIGLDLYHKYGQHKEKSPLNPQAQKLKQYFNSLNQSIEEKLPKGIFISRGHVWIKALPSGKIRVGLDNFCQSLISRIDSIRLNKSGNRVNDGGRMCEICQGEKTLTFLSPLDGTIKEVNTELLQNPKNLCDDPFKSGWIYTIEPSFLGSLVSESDLVNHYYTQKWETSEIERLCKFILHDPEMKKNLEQKMIEEKFSLKGFFDSMSKSVWLKFQENFLRYTNKNKEIK